MKTRIWTALIALYIVWGSTYLAIRFAVETIPPFLMAGTRFLISGLILYVWRRLAGDPAPTLRQWGSAAIMGVLLLLALLLFNGYHNITRSFLRGPEVGGLRLSLFVIAVIYNLTESVFRMSNPVWIMFLMALMAVAKGPAKRISSATVEGAHDDLATDDAGVDHMIYVRSYQEVV